MTNSTPAADIAAVIIAGRSTLAACGGSNDDATSSRATAADTSSTDAQTTRRKTRPARHDARRHHTAEHMPASTADPPTDGWDPAVMERVRDHFCRRESRRSRTGRRRRASSSCASALRRTPRRRTGRSTTAGSRSPLAGRPGPARHATEAAGAPGRAAEAAAAAEDVDAALAAFEHYWTSSPVQTSDADLLAGAPCADQTPARSTGAHGSTSRCSAPGNSGAGFDSVWVAKQFSVRGAARRSRHRASAGNRRRRLDTVQAATGRRPDVGPHQPTRSSPSIPATDTVTATLAEGRRRTGRQPQLGRRRRDVDLRRQRLHRYDPTNVPLVTTVDLGIECGQVYATSDLVVAWTFNQDGESGTSAAAFIDPATNAVVAGVDLPVDVNVPIVLDDAVFFPGYGNAGAASVDRQSWTVTEHDLGVPLGGSQSTTDGTFIYVPTADRLGIVVIDARSDQVVDKIELLDVNSVVATAEGLWVVDNSFGYLQRFDLAT